MSLRLSYWTVAPRAFQALSQLHGYLAGSGLDARLLHLVYLRVSQVNGCGYCVDLHYREALEAGETHRRLNAVAAWRETPFFDERERAALAWAESLTRVDRTGAPDEVYEEVRSRFDDKELADLTFAIAAMNAWNRLGVGFRRGPSAEEGGEG